MTSLLTQYVPMCGAVSSRTSYAYSYESSIDNPPANGDAIHNTIHNALPSAPDVPQDVGGYRKFCEYCGSGLATKQSLSVHKKSCPLKAMKESHNAVEAMLVHISSGTGHSDVDRLAFLLTFIQMWLARIREIYSEKRYETKHLMPSLWIKWGKEFWKYQNLSIGRKTM